MRPVTVMSECNDVFSLISRKLVFAAKNFNMERRARRDDTRKEYDL